MFIRGLSGCLTKNLQINFPKIMLNPGSTKELIKAKGNKYSILFWTLHQQNNWYKAKEIDTKYYFTVVLITLLDSSIIISCLCCFIFDHQTGNHWLTLFILRISFDTPWKHQKTRGFLMFSGGIKRDHWHEIG